MVLFIFEKNILLMRKKIIPCVNFYLNLFFFMTFRLINTSLTIEVLLHFFIPSNVSDEFYDDCIKGVWAVRRLGYALLGI